MKTHLPLTLSAFCLLSLVACDSKKKSPVSTPAPGTPAAEAVNKDIPMLPVHKGDAWTYDVRLIIPQGVTSPDSASVDTTHQRVRTFLGKVSPAEGLPETDCFEVTTPGSPAEREFVEIHDDKVLMRGSMVMRGGNTRPMLLDYPVPFVVAGMKPGTESPEVDLQAAALSRKTQVIAREDVTCPAGTFPSIRLLMTGTDGDLELRRTIWFAPGTGIIREEKIRYRAGKILFRETQQLSKISPAAKN